MNIINIFIIKIKLKIYFLIIEKLVKLLNTKKLEDWIIKMSYATKHTLICSVSRKLVEATSFFFN